MTEAELPTLGDIESAVLEYGRLCIIYGVKDEASLTLADRDAENYRKPSAQAKDAARERIVRLVAPLLAAPAPAGAPGYCASCLGSMGDKPSMYDDETICEKCWDAERQATNAAIEGRAQPAPDVTDSFVTARDAVLLLDAAKIVDRFVELHDAELTISHTARDMGRALRALASRRTPATREAGQQLVSVPDGCEDNYRLVCHTCGKVATKQDIDGDWWPPCEHGPRALYWQRITPTERREPSA